jgi:hypothetical protein
MVDRALLRRYDFRFAGWFILLRQACAAVRSSQVAKKKNSMALFEVISNTRDKNPDSEVIVPEWVRPGYQEEQAKKAQQAQQEKQAEQEKQAQQASEPQEPTAPEPVAPKPVVPKAPAPTPLIPEPPQKEQTELIVPKTVAPKTVVPEPVDPEPVVQAPVTQAPAPQDDVDTTQEASPRPTTSTWEPRHHTNDDAPETPKTAGNPIWSTDGERLTLSLNYISCMVVSMGVLLVVVLAFFLGRMTASPETTPAKAQSTVIKREVGKFYMVIQTLSGGNTAATRAEANRIADFCNKNGEPAEVKSLRGNLIVWSARPFDSKVGEEVRGHALSLQNELGPKYANQYASKYRFAQPQRNGKLAPIMFPYTKPKSR